MGDVGVGEDFVYDVGAATLFSVAGVGPVFGELESAVWGPGVPSARWLGYGVRGRAWCGFLDSRPHRDISERGVS